MKLKTILCSMAAVTMIVPAVTSCSNEEGVKSPVETGIDLTKGERFSLSIGIPEEDMKTRAAGQDPTLTYGSDGLFSFERTIDKLWYAVYNKGTLLYNSTQAGITQAVYDEDSKGFTLDILIPEIDGAINLADYSIFFFAGNESDNIQMEDFETYGIIGLDFANKTLYAYPHKLYSEINEEDIYNPNQYDYFCKYETLDKIVAAVADSEFKGKIVLTRPFCQVSLLTDELRQGTILNTYSDNGKVFVTANPSVEIKKGEETNYTIPYAWKYDTDEILTTYATEFTCHSTALYDNVKKAPQEVKFKDRDMFCVASYLMLAPNTKKAYNSDADSQKFYFDISVSGSRFSTNAVAEAKIPVAGLRANEKYILYNRKYTPSGGDPGETDPDDPNPDPNPGGGGDGGIISNHYDLEIIVDPTWQGNNNLIYPEKN